MTVPLPTPQSLQKTAAENVPVVTELQAQLEQFTRLSEQFADSLQSMQARYTQVQNESAQVSAQRLQELTGKGTLSPAFTTNFRCVAWCRGDC